MPTNLGLTMNKADELNLVWRFADAAEPNDDYGYKVTPELYDSGVEWFYGGSPMSSALSAYFLYVGPNEWREFDPEAEVGCSYGELGEGGDRLRSFAEANPERGARRTLGDVLSTLAVGAVVACGGDDDGYGYLDSSGLRLASAG